VGLSMNTKIRILKPGNNDFVAPARLLVLLSAGKSIKWQKNVNKYTLQKKTGCLMPVIGSTYFVPIWTQSPVIVASFLLGLFLVNYSTNRHSFNSQQFDVFHLAKGIVFWTLVPLSFLLFVLYCLDSVQKNRSRKNKK
jgi:hypothetical protein